jgi:hypothetical protein
MAKSKGGGNPRSIPEGKTQVNFNIKTSTLEKVKKLVKSKLTDAETNSEVFNTATEEYLSKFEKKKG